MVRAVLSHAVMKTKTNIKAGVSKKISQTADGITQNIK